MLRIFLFNNASRAAGYGIGTYLRLLAGGLSSMPDMSLSFIEMNADEKDFHITDDSCGIRHYRIPHVNDSGMESEAYCRSVFYLLARHMAIDECDSVVFQFNYFQHLPLAQMLKGYYPSSKIIFTVHYLNWCFEFNGNETRLHNMLRRHHNGDEITDLQEARVLNSYKYEQRFLHLADVVISLSERTSHIMVDEYRVSKNKIHLVYNGLGTNVACKNRPPATPNRNIVFVGRLDEIKGLKYLLIAFEKIVKSYSDVRLLVAGEGNFRTYIEQSRDLTGYVTFLGMLTPTELDTLYDSSYIGVMPSFHEQCSYTAIEMMRHGLPIVGTDSTGLAEMLDATPQMRAHIDENEFSDEKLADDIALRLDMLLSDKDFHGRISQSVRNMYLERYTLPKMTERVVDILRETLTPQSIVSRDYLVYLDFDIMRLIDKRPDIDTDFFGMSGIGVYLWRRALELKQDADMRMEYATIMEYLVYYMDWLHDSVIHESLPPEMIATLHNMLANGFCKTIVRELLLGISQGDSIENIPDRDTVIIKALRICNYKI